MKNLFKSLLSVSALSFLMTSLFAQIPEVTWDNFYPLDYEIGNYTANDIKESPMQGSYVLVGSRSMNWGGNGYNQVMVMRVDDEGGSIAMNEIFTGFQVDTLYVYDTIKQEYNDEIDTIIYTYWDQVAYDMMFVQEEDLRYLITGYRDTTLLSRDSPPGLFLMEVRGDGRVAFDSLYYNHTNHYMTGYAIEPAIGGGCIVAGSIREDGSGPDKILVTRMAKNEEGVYEPPDVPAFKSIAVADGGYARWVRKFHDGYLLGGSAYNGTDKKFDIFLQKIQEDLGAGWQTFYGGIEMDEFSDAVVSGDYVYVAGSSEVLVGNFYIYKIWVAKIDANGDVVWEKTYGGPTRHFANSIMMTGDGNLVVAGTAYDQTMHTQMLLLNIDGETGDSLWMQTYKTNFTNAGIRDAVHTSGFGYAVAGRASFTSMQDPRVFLMSLNYPDRISMLLERTDLNLEIAQGTPTKDIIDVSADKNVLYGVRVTIDSLIHPSVGDLEITLEHGGTTVKLLDRPRNSGENLIHTGLRDGAEKSLDLGLAPYSGWFLPEEPLAPFKLHSPAGEWTLTVTDLGPGGVKSTSMLVDWNLNLLVDSGGGGTDIPTQEKFASFGLEPIRPNPVSQEAVIAFRIPNPAEVKITVYNQLGQQVEVLVNEHLGEGEHMRRWIPGSLAPGTYFIQLESGGMISVRKALVTR